MRRSRKRETSLKKTHTKKCPASETAVPHRNELRRRRGTAPIYAPGFCSLNLKTIGFEAKMVLFDVAGVHKKCRPHASQTFTRFQEKFPPVGTRPWSAIWRAGVPFKRAFIRPLIIKKKQGLFIQGRSPENYFTVMIFSIVS